MMIIGLLSVRTARALRDQDHSMEDVFRRMSKHRLSVQVIGMVSIFFTALWGMYQNLVVGVLGG